MVNSLKKCDLPKNLTRPKKFNSKEAEKVWERVFLQKIDRLAERLKECRSDIGRIFILKLCFSAYPKIRSELFSSKNLYLDQFFKKVYPFLEGQTFYETQMYLKRIVQWFHRIGVDKEIWDSI